MLKTTPINVPDLIAKSMPHTLSQPISPVRKQEYLPAQNLTFSITSRGIAELTPALFALPPIKLSFPHWCDNPASLFQSLSIGRHTNFHLHDQLLHSENDSLPWRLVQFESYNANLNLVFLRNRPKLLKEFSRPTEYFIERHTHTLTVSATFANFSLQTNPEDNFEVIYGIRNYTSRSVKTPKPRIVTIQHSRAQCLVCAYSQYFDLHRDWDPRELERPWLKTVYAPSSS